MKQAYYVVVSMRPKQWTKNLVVFAGLIFSRNFAHAELLVRSVEAFVVFCILSGVIYLINDIADIEKDRRHPTKCLRPLASGALKKTSALTAALLLALAGLFLAQRLGPGFLVVACLFAALNLVYSFGLKRVVLLDVASISLSFVSNFLHEQFLLVDVLVWIALVIVILGDA
jgi:4-hydroxybenzoate polyprenyltransferase